LPQWHNAPKKFKRKNGFEAKIWRSLKNLSFFLYTFLVAFCYYGMVTFLGQHKILYL
jgi:hypothetical protein